MLHGLEILKRGQQHRPVTLSRWWKQFLIDPWQNQKRNLDKLSQIKHAISCKKIVSQSCSLQVSGSMIPFRFWVEIRHKGDWKFKEARVECSWDRKTNFWQCQMCHGQNIVYGYCHPSHHRNPYNWCKSLLINLWPSPRISMQSKFWSWHKWERPGLIEERRERCNQAINQLINESISSNDWN
jgi:hypothetical protein